MDSASRHAMATAREQLDQVLGEGAEAEALADDLFAVARLVAESGPLRRALADSSREGEAKAQLAGTLLGDRVSAPALSVTRTTVQQRWSSAADLTNALDTLAVQTVLAQAEAQGRLTQVEDELFRFNRIVGGSTDLRAALTDRRAHDEAKVALVRELLEGKSAPETQRLATHAVGRRAQRFDHAIEFYLVLAAERQDQVRATVTSAVPLQEQQLEQLTAALSQQYGRTVHAVLIVDPDVVGGLRVEIGDEVIDGTIRTRLDDARRRLTR